MPSRREFLASSAAALAAPPVHPNILFIVCDQLNAAVTSVYGGPVATPHLERLARRGVVFTQATCATPFCSPTRATMITGLYPHAHGIVYNVNRRDYPAIGGPSTEEGILTSDVTTERLLNEAGYATHHFGKWHLSGDDLPYYPVMYGEHREYAREMQAVFDRVRRGDRAGWMDWYGWALPVDVDARYRRAAAPLEADPRSRRLAEFVAKMGRLRLPLSQVFDVRVADRAVETLSRAGRGPFMLTCSFNLPHDPNVVPSPYYEAFPPERIELPASFGRRETRFESDWSRRIVAVTGETGAREFLRVYYGMVKLLDDQVGRVLDALETAGRARDTIVVFTSDHGDMAGGHGMVWKSTSAFYDEIARVPLIVSWPGRIRPARSDIAASHADLMPTLLELAGRPVPRAVQGESLAPHLLGRRSSSAPVYSFCERVQANRELTRRVAPGAPAQFMVRGAGWKYVHYSNGDECLYDLRKDPGETHNLALEARHRAQKQALRRELEAWLDRTGYRAGPATPQPLTSPPAP